MATLELLTELSDKVRSATVTMSSENPLYPALNLKSSPIAKRARSVNGVTSLQILMYLGSNYPVDCAVLVNHNLTSTATITLRAGTTSACSDFSQSAVWRESNIYCRLASTQTLYAYWMWEIVDATNPYTYVAAGRALAGLLDKNTPNVRLDLEDADVARNAMIETPWGVTHTERRYDRKEIDNMVFSPVTETQVEALRAIIKPLYDDLIPAFLLLKPSTKYQGWYMRLYSDFRVRYDTTRLYTVGPFNWKEEPRGLVLS